MKDIATDLLSNWMAIFKEGQAGIYTHVHHCPKYTVVYSNQHHPVLSLCIVSVLYVCGELATHKRYSLTAQVLKAGHPGVL